VHSFFSLSQGTYGQYTYDDTCYNAPAGRYIEETGTYYRSWLGEYPPQCPSGWIAPYTGFVLVVCSVRLSFVSRLLSSTGPAIVILALPARKKITTPLAAIAVLAIGVGLVRYCCFLPFLLRF
jgi:hypothetical protein